MHHLLRRSNNKSLVTGASTGSSPNRKNLRQKIAGYLIYPERLDDNSVCSNARQEWIGEPLAINKVDRVRCGELLERMSLVRFSDHD